MAAAVSSSSSSSSVRAKPGAWALEAEEQEAELKQQQDSSASEFPSLAAAAASTKTKKKKKGKTVSLAEFTAVVPPQTERLTTNELISLPTGSHQRSPEELDRTKLGGGFRSYGRSRSGDDSLYSSWRSSKISEDGERRGGGFSRDLAPSRADETDNWAAAKKPMGNGNGSERRERMSGFLEYQSKAGEVDRWVRSKPFSESMRFSSTSNGGSLDSLSRNSDTDSRGRRNEDLLDLLTWRTNNKAQARVEASYSSRGECEARQTRQYCRETFQRPRLETD